MSFIGGLGVFSSFCYTQSLRYSSPTFVAPFEYTRILYAIPVGFLFFSELPTLQTYLGATIIIIAITLLNRKSKPKRAAEASDNLVLEEKVIKRAS